MTETTPETARLTADVALFAEHTDQRLYVLVIRRGWEPFEGHWALPGGHVDEGEQVLDAAHRELFEETGVGVGRLIPVGVYAAPGRDPRGRYVTWAYANRILGLRAPVAGDDAVEVRWMPVDEALSDSARLAFDHKQIVHDALRAILRSVF